MNTAMQEQKQKGKKSYQELLNEARSLMSKTAAVFIPELCNALKAEQPELTNDEIKEQVISDCEGIYVYDTIRHSWPSWVIDEVAQRNRKIGWEKINKAKLNSVGKITTDLVKVQLPEPPKDRDKNVIDDEEWERSAPSSKYLEIGEKGHTVMEQVQEIRAGAFRLFQGLTEKTRFPSPHNEDLILDYIKPTREFRRNLVLEMEESSRIRLYNDLGAVDAAVQDMLEIIEQNKKKK